MHGTTAAAVGALIASGHAGDAIEAAVRALEADPANPEWLHLLAVAQNARGSRDEALASIERALKVAPRDPTLWNTRGAVLIERGDLSDAEAALREALRLDAGYLEARFNLALLLRRRGALAACAEELERILAGRPDFAPARLERATLRIETGDAAAALPELDALDLAYPANPRVLANRAAAFQRLGRVDDCSRGCHAALALADIDASGVAAIAQTLAAAGFEDEARAAARRAVAMAAHAPEVRVLAADALAVTGNAAEAREHYEFAVRARPDAALLAKLGHASLVSGDAARAADAFERQLRLEPGSRAASLHLAIALRTLGRRSDAAKVLWRAVELGARDAGMLSTLAAYKAQDCDWTGLDTLVAELRHAARVPGPHPAFPQHALLFEGIPASEQRAWAEAWARKSWPETQPRPRRERHGGRMRIGYLSGDFNDHPVSHLAIGLFENRDRARFEAVAYSYGPDDRSALRARLEGAFERFVELGSLSDQAAAERIRADRLDVLVDLGGYVKDARLGILAHRPAPTQLHFLGYAATTGAPFIDFYVADGYTVPPAQEQDFTEAVLRMPVCHQPSDATRGISARPSRAECGLPGNALVLCSFNQEMKISRAVFERWCDLLLAIPHAVLWLATPAAEARRNLEAHAASRGVDPARVVFAPRLAKIEDHLARLANADLALDTFPYGSHTTASDALWAGVPLVALSGNTFASRVAGSILSAADCGDLAFESHDEAFSATLALARDARALAGVRERVARARTRSPLFDNARFARDFESLLEDAVARTA